MMRWLATLFLACMALPLSAQDAPQAPRTLRVLFVGNSLVYVNNLPAVLRAVAGAQPVPVVIDTQTFVAPGGTVAERWKDGHAAAALASGHWDFVVLQERGGLLACMVDPDQRTSADCRASDAAHRAFARAAKTAGARVLLMSTWGPDKAWQGRLDRAAQQLAGRLHADVVPAGPTLRAYAAQHGEDATFPDKLHPSLAATLVMAAQFHRATVGTLPRPTDVTLDFALLPVRAAVSPESPIESQPQLRGDGHKVLVKADAMQALIEAAR